MDLRPTALVQIISKIMKTKEAHQLGEEIAALVQAQQLAIHPQSRIGTIRLFPVKEELLST
jgi:hypothetical protein